MSIRPEIEFARLLFIGQIVEPICLDQFQVEKTEYHLDAVGSHRVGRLFSLGLSSIDNVRPVKVYQASGGSVWMAATYCLVASCLQVVCENNKDA
ncbi:hypothetical protein [Thermostichus vulcanus]|uniref:Uncharacterized protein n=1 Tax=Thermostichus vulcanus str. 'Rupite' TaxID=2813851 RepID=A0ABT0CGE5_THEVL|nr:hypothetical protein [Thermostichus vulcanus]MCJ2544495.1 hypothetical protein [Thermostichus vulcanus str. 'Rupite']